MTEQTFYIMDLQDTANNWEATLQEVKQYIIDYWVDNDPEDVEFETEQAWEDFTELVQNGDTEQLDSCLQGIGYVLFDSEKDMRDWIKEFGA